MKLVSPITTAQVLSLVATYSMATHLRFLKAGGKRMTCLALLEVNVSSFDFSSCASVELGTRAAGLPFEPLDLANLPTVPEKKAAAPAPAASGPSEKLIPGMTARLEEIAKLQHVRARVRNYTAYMDSLLLDLVVRDGKPVEVEGYLRSKFTVNQALRLVLKRYPKKSAASVKRILKVRPRHLEKMKTLGAFDDAKLATRAPRWFYVGPGSGVEFVHSIRKLIEGGRTPEKAADLACREFGREMSDGLRIAKSAAARIRAANGNTGPSLKERQLKKATAKTALKARNRQLRAEALAKRAAAS